INGMYTPSFATANIVEVIEECREIEAKLSSFGLPVFANSGTLLGLVREGTLLAHDNDIDLGVILGARDDAAAAREWLALCERLIAEDLAKYRSDWSGVTLKLQDIGGFGVDLFPAWVDEAGRVHIYPHTRGELCREQLLP